MKNSTFEATPGLRNPHLQTLVSRAARSRNEPRYARHRIDTDDGDFVDLDVWTSPPDPRGVCLLLHGLEGCARSGYMVSTCGALTDMGIQAVALNFRSCSGEPNRTPQSYHSGRTDDIERSLDWVAERYPGLARTAVGFSLGGNALLNLVGRDGARPDLAGAVAVSVPYDLAACADALERGLGRMYAHYFMRTLREKARVKAARFPGQVAPEAARSRTIREFDDRLTAPVHGFRDADDYYERCSAGRYVGSVEVPTLLIQSADDPLVPRSTIPVDAIRDRDNLSLELTTRGGHVGFFDRRLGTGRGGWLEQSIARYVAGVVGSRDDAPDADPGTGLPGGPREPTV